MLLSNVSRKRFELCSNKLFRDGQKNRSPLNTRIPKGVCMAASYLSVHTELFQLRARSGATIRPAER